LRIVPGFTEANALDLFYMPYTHSLPGALALSILFGGLAATLIAGERGTTFAVVSAAAFSHWILDLVVHIPDLPLYDNAAKVGLGLWRHVALSFPLELVLLITGAWIYTRAVPPASLRGHNAMRGFVALLVLLQVYANFGPPPASESAMAIMALGFYAVLAGDRGLGRSGARTRVILTRQIEAECVEQPSPPRRGQPHRPAIALTREPAELERAADLRAHQAGDMLSSYGPSGVSAKHPAVRSARLAGRRIAIAIGTFRASA
jgi:hypothetical protein